MYNFNKLHMHILCVKFIFVLVIHLFAALLLVVVVVCGYFRYCICIFFFWLQLVLSHLVALHPLTKLIDFPTSYSFSYNFSLPQNFCSTFSCCPCRISTTN